MHIRYPYSSIIECFAGRNRTTKHRFVSHHYFEYKIPEISAEPAIIADFGRYVQKIYDISGQIYISFYRSAKLNDFGSGIYTGDRENSVIFINDEEMTLGDSRARVFSDFLGVYCTVAAENQRNIIGGNNVNLGCFYHHKNVSEAQWAAENWRLILDDKKEEMLEYLTKIFSCLLIINGELCCIPAKPAQLHRNEYVCLWAVWEKQTDNIEWVNVAHNLLFGYDNLPHILGNAKITQNALIGDMNKYCVYNRNMIVLHHYNRMTDINIRHHSDELLMLFIKMRRQINSFLEKRNIQVSPHRPFNTLKNVFKSEDEAILDDETFEEFLSVMQIIGKSNFIDKMISFNA